MFLYAEYQEHPSSAGPPTGEWVLVDTAEGSQLGTEKRVEDKKAIAGNMASCMVVSYLGSHNDVM